MDLLFHQHRFDWKLSHFHRQHALSMRVRIICSFRERDSADACAPDSPRLNLHDNFTAEFLCRRDSFVSR